jgi:hypothetical protein
VTKSSGELTREEKAENLLFSYSMILMATFEEAFANLASSMTDALAKTGSAVANAMSSSFGDNAEAGSDSSSNLDDLGPRTSEKVKDAFDQIRTQARSDFSAKEGSIRSILNDPVIDEGVKIVESFDFKLPRLTERLGDDDLSKYMTLLHDKDPKIMRMLQKLAAWQEKLPRPAPDGK